MESMRLSKRHLEFSSKTAAEEFSSIPPPFFMTWPCVISTKYFILNYYNIKDVNRCEDFILMSLNHQIKYGSVWLLVDILAQITTLPHKSDALMYKCRIFKNAKFSPDHNLPFVRLYVQGCLWRAHCIIHHIPTRDVLVLTFCRQHSHLLLKKLKSHLWAYICEHTNEQDGNCFE